MTALVFSFDDLDSDKAGQALSHYFQGVGAQVVQTAVDPRVRRTSGISFKQIDLTFADGQRLSLMVKQSGDIYQVLLNGSAIAIKDQHDQVAAIAEMVKAMDSGRTQFQVALSKARAVLPATIRMSTPKVEASLKDKLENITHAIALAHEELAQ